MGSLIIAVAQLILVKMPALMGLSSEFKENSLDLLKLRKELMDEKEETQKDKKKEGIDVPYHGNLSPDFHVKIKNVKLDHSSKETDACHTDPEVKSPLYPDDKDATNAKEVNQLLEYISDAKGLFEDNIKIFNLFGQIISGESCEENIEVIERLCTGGENSYYKSENFEELYGLVVGNYLVENSCKYHSMRFSDDSLDLLTKCQLPSSISVEELEADSKRKTMSGYLEYVCSTNAMNCEEGEGFIEMKRHLKKQDNVLVPKNRYEQGIEMQKQNQMEKENAYLKKQLQSLEIKYEEVLNELGKFMFVEEANKNETRKSEIFQRMFLSSSYKHKQFRERDHLSDKPKVNNVNSPSNFSHTIYEKITSVGGDSFAVNEPDSSEPPAPEAKALLQNGENNPKTDKERTMAPEKNKCEFENANKGKEINRYGSKNKSSSRKISSESATDLLQQRMAKARLGIESQGGKHNQAVQGETSSTKRTSYFGLSSKQGMTSSGNCKEIQVRPGETKEITGIIDLGPSFEQGATGKKYEFKVNQQVTEEIMLAGGVGSTRQGIANCITGNTNQVKEGETSTIKRVSAFVPSITRGTTNCDNSKANLVIQGKKKGATGVVELRSSFEHAVTSGGKGSESKVIQGEAKETKVTGDVGSSLQQRTKNGGKSETNRVNEEEKSTTKEASDFGSSSLRGTTSNENIKGNQMNQSDTKKTNKTNLGYQNVKQSSIRQNYESLSFSVQQDDRNGTDYISLSNVPPISVVSTLYNNYKLLLMTLAERLLSSQVVELKKWASQKFSVNISHNATDALFQLDQNGVINASNLSDLRDFFEYIVRYDLVHIIDTFLLGDYSIVWQTSSIRRKTTNDQARRSDIQQITPPTTMQFSTRSSSVNENPVLGTANHQRTQDNARYTNISNNSTYLSGELPNSNFTTNPNNLERKDLHSTAQYEQQNITPSETGHIATEMTNTVVANNSDTSNGRTNSNSQTIGSNGFKLSKFQSPETRTAFPAGSPRNPAIRNEDINWLCSHYRRRCYVKFECCDTFWPCHRCHNNQSTCGRKKLKSRDTEMLKCVNCGKVQQFGEYCCECNVKFANYYCGLCKHLTGTDDHPFHCQKCGICRIHGDRSFHCDICGVCLDVQLRGNHKCREDSAHDECCICLEVDHDQNSRYIISSVHGLVTSIILSLFIFLQMGRYHLLV